MKKTDGFTLVELVVGILCAAVVTGAAISVMLMNARINRTVIDANVDLQNARIVTTLVERLASEGNIASLQISGEPGVDENGNYEDGYRSWELYDNSDNVILSFSPAREAIYGRNNSILMENVKASALTLSPSAEGGCLLGFSIYSGGKLFETTVYSRASKIDAEGIVLDKNTSTIVDHDKTDSSTTTITPSENETVPDDDGRLAFLSILASQYGSPGYVLGSNPPVYFSQWYEPTWEANTAWCGCFISWAVAQTSATTSYTPAGFIPFANVDTGWTNFKQASLDYNRSQVATPGDLIFFSWDSDDIKLEHVGVVLYVDTTPGRNYVYTIEGNSSNQVALRRYSRDDSRIVGYGVLNWNSTP